MKNLLAVAAVASIFACSVANAARLSYEPAPTSPNGVYSIYLAGEDTVFNGVGLSVKPDGGASFQNPTSGNVAGAPRPAGFEGSYRNRLLDADVSEIPESKQWTLLGVVNSAAEIAFSGGPLGQTINTSGEPGGKLFLANIWLPAGATATATLQLVNGVDTVFTQTLPIPIPEPATFGLGSFALLGLAALRRRVA
jgi:hypothetical protein